jgi:hypothetical protein
MKPTKRQDTSTLFFRVSSIVRIRCLPTVLDLVHDESVALGMGAEDWFDSTASEGFAAMSLAPTSTVQQVTAQPWMKDRAANNLGTGKLAPYYVKQEQQRLRRLQAIKSVVKIGRQPSLPPAPHLSSAAEPPMRQPLNAPAPLDPRRYNIDYKFGPMDYPASFQLPVRKPSVARLTAQAAAAEQHRSDSASLSDAVQEPDEAAAYGEEQFDAHNDHADGSTAAHKLDSSSSALDLLDLQQASANAHSSLQKQAASSHRAEQPAQQLTALERQDALRRRRKTSSSSAPESSSTGSSSNSNARGRAVPVAGGRVRRVTVGSAAAAAASIGISASARTLPPAAAAIRPMPGGRVRRVSAGARLPPTAAPAAIAGDSAHAAAAGTVAGTVARTVGSESRQQRRAAAAAEAALERRRARAANSLQKAKGLSALAAEHAEAVAMLHELQQAQQQQQQQHLTAVASSTTLHNSSSSSVSSLHETAVAALRISAAVSTPPLPPPPPILALDEAVAEVHTNAAPATATTAAATTIVGSDATAAAVGAAQEAATLVDERARRAKYQQWWLETTAQRLAAASSSAKTGASDNVQQICDSESSHQRSEVDLNTHEGDGTLNDIAADSAVIQLQQQCGDSSSDYDGSTTDNTAASTSRAIGDAAAAASFEQPESQNDECCDSVSEAANSTASVAADAQQKSLLHTHTATLQQHDVAVAAAAAAAAVNENTCDATAEQALSEDSLSDALEAQTITNTVSIDSSSQHIQHAGTDRDRSAFSREDAAATSTHSASFVVDDEQQFVERSSSSSEAAELMAATGAPPTAVLTAAPALAAAVVITPLAAVEGAQPVSLQTPPSVPTEAALSPTAVHNSPTAAAAATAAAELDNSTNAPHLLHDIDSSSDNVVLVVEEAGALAEPEEGING